MCGRVGHIQGNLAQGVCEPVRASARLCAKFCLKGGYQGRFSDLRQGRQKRVPPGACYNILERKAFSRGFLGVGEQLLGRLVLLDDPLVDEDDPVGHLPGKAHLVGSPPSMVMPVWASSFIRASTSPTISGSRAEVGSSNRMTSGSMARARAMAIAAAARPTGWRGRRPPCPTGPPGPAARRPAGRPPPCFSA